MTLARNGNPRMLEFLLRRFRPTVYNAPQQVKFADKGGWPITVEQRHDLSRLSSDQLAALGELVALAAPVDEQEDDIGNDNGAIDY